VDVKGIGVSVVVFLSLLVSNLINMGDIIVKARKGPEPGFGHRQGLEGRLVGEEK
jgi:Na+-transporting methylmalonyl-CoA/oxaloacetate decarboxylase gamma subunit